MTFAHGQSITPPSRTHHRFWEEGQQLMLPARKLPLCARRRGTSSASSAPALYRYSITSRVLHSIATSGPGIAQYWWMYICCAPCVVTPGHKHTPGAQKLRVKKGMCVCSRATWEPGVWCPRQVSHTHSMLAVDVLINKVEFTWLKAEHHCGALSVAHSWGRSKHAFRVVCQSEGCACCRRLKVWLNA